MKIVLAQFRKDIQCQRQPLILWVICLALGVIPFAIIETLKHWHHIHPAPVDFSDTQKIVGALSFVAIFTMCMFAAAFGMFLFVPILVIRIVHEDTLMGTTAFWLTRPVPRAKLLLAKTLFIAILLLPLILGAQMNAHVGEGQFWLAETAWIAAVAALASITPGVQPFLGYGAAFLFGKVIFSGIIDKLWGYYYGADSAFSQWMAQHYSSVGQLLHLSTADLFHLCYLIGFSAVFIHQYLTLRTRKSLAFFILTLVAVGLLQMFASPLADSSSGPVFHIETNSSHTP
ncbi:MAG TPA: hypothetical protein VGM54_17615 [Chthoniobacter sp.]|jgi:hypothetical protein